jgi:glycosyltransferase involved in cell wall biosynthesis
MARYFPDVRFEVDPHEKDLPVRQSARVASNARSTMRVGLLGGISDIKGFHVLVACANDARSRGLPLEFVVIGHTMDDRIARAAGVDITGAYADEQLQQKIADADLDAIFLPSTWPETYSYTLSAALQTDLPIVVFDIGAPARRVRGVRGAIVLPLDLAKQPHSLNTKLLERLCSKRVPNPA